MTCANKYIIPRTSLEIERLDLMHQIYLNCSASMLENAGLSKAYPPKLTVFDVACATGAMTSWIAERTTGKVIGLDNDIEQLKVAKNRLACYPLVKSSMVEFKQIDLNKVVPISMYADIVYSRFVLHHLPKPTVGINNIINMTKPGGQIIFGEPVADGSWAFPYEKKYNESINLLVQLYTRKSIDVNYGQKLYNDLAMFSNIKIIDVQYYTPLLISEKHKEYHLMIMETFKEQFIETCNITPERYNILIQHLKNIVYDTNFIMSAVGIIFIRAEKL